MELGRARDIFVKASARYPASVTAQGAYIAQECMKNGEQPKEMSRLLCRWRDPTAMATLLELASLARNAHSAAGIEDAFVSPRSLRYIIRQDVRLAKRVLKSGATPEQITAILESAPRYRGDETYFRKKVCDRYQIKPTLFERFVFWMEGY